MQRAAVPGPAGQQGNFHIGGLPHLGVARLAALLTLCLSACSPPPGTGWAGYAEGD